ncbi:uncharacterized protein TNCV_203571 [Trichonephila clavipes]|nr:uncharacterized protein TNCV_203571 [Trichonephila clavipes]
MAPIDCAEPNVEDGVEISDNRNEIRRKTKINIVNEVHEWKAEEYAWYFHFSYGKNRLREQRDVPITPLDYFQYRILGNITHDFNEMTTSSMLSSCSSNYVLNHI